jgi:hypothetical protein
MATHLADDEEDHPLPLPHAEEDIEAMAYKTFKNTVAAFGDENMDNLDPILFNYNSLRPQRLGGVQTVQTFKNYRPIILNARIGFNYNVFPFGYTTP